MIYTQRAPCVKFFPRTKKITEKKLDTRGSVLAKLSLVGRDHLGTHGAIIATPGGRDPAICPAKGRRDWFLVSRWIFDSFLVGVPGVQFEPSGIFVHRSHLPLLGLSWDVGVVPVPELRARLDQETLPRGYQLRSYQHDALDFIAPRRGVLLADSMRLGKSAVAVHAHDPSTGPLVVVAPKATRDVWIQWIQSRFPDWADYGVVLSGRAYVPEKLQSARYILMHYDIAPAWQSLGRREIGLLVLDEAHLLSNPKSRRSQAMILLSSRARKVLALTGTPLWNKPSGVHAILTLLNPGAWGKFYDYAERWCAGRPGTHGYIADGVSRVDEFRSRLREVMLRREWKDVQAELPALTRTVEVADIPAQAALEIEKLVESIRDAAARRVHAGEVARYRRLVGGLKVPVAVACARAVLDGGEPVVIWTWHRDVARQIATTVQAYGDFARPAYLVTGETPDPSRELAAWRADPTPSALVITLAVGQAGIDLAHARHAVFAEIDYTPAVVAQGEMRTFHPSRPMAVTYIVVDHPVDRMLIKTLIEKCALARELGTPAAESALDTIGAAFGIDTRDPGDLARLARDWCGALTDTGSQDVRPPREDTVCTPT